MAVGPSRFSWPGGAPRERDAVAYQIPTQTPGHFQIGTSWFWDVAYPEFPASDGWQLNLYFRGPTDLTVAWASGISASGNTFQVRITPTLAQPLKVGGSYRLYGTVTLSGEVHEVENRIVSVAVAATTPVGAKSFNRQMLEAIETAMLAGATSSTDARRIEINGRVIEYRDREELNVLRSRYMALVAVEDNPNGRIIHEVTFV